MDVKDLIYIKDNVLPIEALSSLIKWINHKDEKFVKSRVVLSHGKEDALDEKIRKVENFTLLQNSKSMTEVHWANYLLHNFMQHINYYQADFKMNCSIEGIIEITVLKYENSGHYSYHTDHCRKHPRTLSIIFLLNNDYEGGELVFGSVDKQQEIMRVKKNANRLILWPSNFVYPHKVEPVTKGRRYSIVSWSL